MISLQGSDHNLDKYESSFGNQVNKSRFPFIASSTEVDEMDNGRLKDKLTKVIKENFKLTDGILLIIVAIISGYLVKKIIIGRSHNHIKKLLGEMFLVAVTSFVTNHPEEVKEIQNTLSRWVQKLKGRQE